MTKGSVELLDDPIAQQLLSSTIPARVAYTWTDGTPRVVSLWFHWDGTNLVLGTFGPAPKLKALRSGSRVALTIDTDSVPNRVLSIRGVAQVTSVTGIVPEYALCAARYLGAEYGRAYIDSRTCPWRASRCDLMKWFCSTSKRDFRAHCRRLGL